MIFRISIGIILSSTYRFSSIISSHAILYGIAVGTKYTMTQDFYKEKLISRGIAVIIPDAADVELINHVIYDELCLGIISDESRKQYIRIIEQLKSNGAEGVILGCTEIGLLIHQKDSSLPVFDTTQIHAKRAAMISIT